MTGSSRGTVQRHDIHDERVDLRLRGYLCVLVPPRESERIEDVDDA